MRALVIQHAHIAQYTQHKLYTCQMMVWITQLLHSLILYQVVKRQHGTVQRSLGGFCGFLMCRNLHYRFFIHSTSIPTSVGLPWETRYYHSQCRLPAWRAGTVVQQLEGQRSIVTCELLQFHWNEENYRAQRHIIKSQNTRFNFSSDPRIILLYFTYWTLLKS